MNVSRCDSVIAAGAIAIAGTAGTARRRRVTPTPLDQLRSFVCQKALDPPARAVSVQAVMRPVTGTSRMQMRFDLCARPLRERLSRWCAGGSLGSWISPHGPDARPAPRRCVDPHHPVVDLAAPATYRFRVSSAGSGRRVSGSATADADDRRLLPARAAGADLLVRSLNVGASSPGSSGRPGRRRTRP